MSLRLELSRILKHSSIYGIGNILHKIPPLILLPLYLNYLTPEDYGKKEIVGLVVDFIGIVVSMQIASAMARFYYDYSAESNRNTVVSTIIISFGIGAGVFLFTLGVFSKEIASIIIDSETDHYLVMMAIASLYFNTLFHMACVYLRILEKSLLYVIISLFKLIAQLTMNISFIVYLKWGIYGIFASTLISSIFFCLLLLIPIFIKIKLRFSVSLLKKVLSFSAPMVISQLTATIVHVSDRYLIKAFVDLASAGIYTIGYRLGNSINQFVNSPFQQIWNPRRFAISNQENAKYIYSKVLTYYSIVQFCIATLIVACVKDLLIIIGKPVYYPAANIAPIITFSYILFGIQKHFSTGLLITKKTKYFAFINTSNAIINLGLNLLFYTALRHLCSRVDNLFLYAFLYIYDILLF